MSIITRTAIGRDFDLCAAAPILEINWLREVAEPLAKQARFNGQTPGIVYSVAQHCVVGADAMLVETGKPLLALAFLLHDAHEAFIGDITTPTKNALRHLAGDAPTARAFEAAIADLKARIDQRLIAAVGLPILENVIRYEGVTDMDHRLCAAEFRLLMKGPLPDAFANAAPVKLYGGLRPWPWPKAADEWMQRFAMWRHACRETLSTLRTL